MPAEVVTIAARSRTLAWILASLYLVLASGMTVFYWAAGLETHAGLKILFALVGLIVFWKLVEAECAPYRVTFPLDIGLFLYALTPVLLPYYFWRTQRWWGLLKAAALPGLWLASFLTWWAVAWLLVRV